MKKVLRYLLCWVIASSLLQARQDEAKLRSFSEHIQMYDDSKSFLDEKNAFDEDMHAYLSEKYEGVRLGRQYPFMSRQTLKVALKVIIEVASSCLTILELSDGQESSNSAADTVSPDGLQKRDDAVANQRLQK